MNKVLTLFIVIVLMASCITTKVKVEDERVCTQEEINRLAIGLITPMALAQEVEDSSDQKLNLIELNFILRRLGRAEKSCELVNVGDIKCRVKVESGVFVDALEATKTTCYGLIQKSKIKIEEQIKKDLEAK